MAKVIRYLILFMAYVPLVAMDSNNYLKVTLNAPEYWQEVDGKWEQYDLDRNGQLCPMGPREQLLELRYIQAFPKLQSYLAKNNNMLRGFDPKMFNVLRNCLALSLIHKTTQDSHEQDQIEKEIQGIFDKKNYTPSLLLDALYVSRLAGLDLIEKLSIHAFKLRTYNNRPITVEDVYPSYSLLNDIGPGEITDEDVIETDLSSESDESSEYESESKSQESFADTSESESDISFDEIRDKHSSFVSFFSWIKSFFVQKNLSKELILHKTSPFGRLKLKKQPDSWFQKCKSLFAIVFCR